MSSKTIVWWTDWMLSDTEDSVYSFSVISIYYLKKKESVNVSSEGKMPSVAKTGLGDRQTTESLLLCPTASTFLSTILFDQAWSAACMLGRLHTDWPFNSWSHVWFYYHFSACCSSTRMRMTCTAPSALGTWWFFDSARFATSFSLFFLCNF